MARGGGGGGGTDKTKPTLKALKLSSKRVRIGELAATTPTIRYTLSEAANVTLSVDHVTAGRKIGSRCVKAKRSNRRRKRCTRYVAAKPALKFANQAAGQRRIRFRRHLKPGAYRLTLRARDTAGNLSSRVRARITVLPRKR